MRSIEQMVNSLKPGIGESVMANQIRETLERIESPVETEEEINNKDRNALANLPIFTRELNLSGNQSIEDIQFYFEYIAEYAEHTARLEEPKDDYPFRGAPILATKYLLDVIDVLPEGTRQKVLSLAEHYSFKLSTSPTGEGTIEERQSEVRQALLRVRPEIYTETISQVREQLNTLDNNDRIAQKVPNIHVAFDMAIHMRDFNTVIELMERGRDWSGQRQREELLNNAISYLISENPEDGLNAYSTILNYYKNKVANEKYRGSIYRDSISQLATTLVINNPSLLRTMPSILEDAWERLTYVVNMTELNTIDFFPLFQSIISELPNLPQDKQYEIQRIITLSIDNARAIDDSSIEILLTNTDKNNRTLRKILT